MMIAGLASCASRKHHAAAKPPAQQSLYAGHTATLDLTAGLRVNGIVSMPSVFTPDFNQPPMWLQQGSEIGVVGSMNGKTTLLGFGGPDFSTRTIEAQDFGPAAPGGRIVDIAASPDGMELAVAVAEPTQNRLEVVLRDLISSGQGHPTATIDGDFEFAQIQWRDAATVALTLRASADAITNVGGSGGGAAGVGGLYIITVTGATAVQHLDGITCPLSAMSFSPNRYFAVGSGVGETVEPVIIATHEQGCRALKLPAPIRVLGWAPDSSSMLYAAASGPGGAAGVFDFDLASGGVSSVIAISSGAAAYASDGTVVALGNNALSWRRLAHEPNRMVKAQVALIAPRQHNIDLNSLGFETLPALMARAKMTFSTASNDGVIDVYIPGAAGPLRRVIEYSYPARAAFVLGSGAAEGPIAMSWSPDGRLLSIVDGNATLNTLAVIAPAK
jgi:hypothetical protein